MQHILDIRLQKFFLITIILKIGSSFLGWYFQYTWSLGFAVPLIFMAIYIIFGVYRHDKDVTDEKFADTCYFLGFIFTITSIIFSLFDLPNIGMKIQDLSVRFGAAMVSTVLGLGVRVYLVSFKRDAADAIRDVEDAVIEASQKLNEQLVTAFDRLRTFESEVESATKATVDRVNTQVEALSINHADKLSDFFIDLTNRNQQAFTQALNEVKTASLRLSSSVDDYSIGMRNNLTSIETKVTNFTEAITDRLRTTTFPDEYFAKHLEAPLAQLTTSANMVSGSVKMVASEVDESSVVVSGALKKLRARAKSAEGTLDKVINLTAQQQAVLETAEGQVTVLGQLASALSNFDTMLSNTLASINTTNAVTSDLTTRVGAVVVDGRQARQSLENSLAAILGKLDSNATATDMVAAKLDDNASATQLVAGKLDRVAIADMQTATMLSNIAEQASTSINKVDRAMEQLQGMVKQLSALDSALRTQSNELKQVAGPIRDVKVTVDMPPFVNASVTPTFLTECSPGQSEFYLPRTSQVAPTTSFGDTPDATSNTIQSTSEGFSFSGYPLSAGANKMLRSEHGQDPVNIPTNVSIVPRSQENLRPFPPSDATKSGT